MSRSRANVSNLPGSFLQSPCRRVDGPGSEGSHAGKHNRHYVREASAPVYSQIRDGVTACKDVSIQEAWAKCAVKKRDCNEGPAAVFTWDGATLAESVSNDHKIGVLYTGSRSKLRTVSEQQSSLQATRPFVRRRPPELVLERNDSCTSKSSYASDSSWLYSAQTLQSQCSRSSTSLTPVNQVHAAIDDASESLHHRNKSTEVIMPTSRDAGAVKEKDEDDSDKAYLQTQLGRPTDSDDSPYAICSQYRLRPRVCLAYDETKAAAPSEARLGMLKNFRQSVMWMIGRTSACQKVAQKPSAAVQVKDENGTASRISSVPSVSSIYYSDDEAGKLWKTLEQTLGIDLDCRDLNIKSKGEGKTPLEPRVHTLANVKKSASRIPRLRPDYRFPRNSIEQQHQTDRHKRESRLPVPTASRTKQCWKPKEKRDSGVALQPQHLPPSKRANIDAATTKTRQRASDIAALPLVERRRLENVMRQQCWKGASLRLAC